MTNLYLIAHKVRGEAAFDVATQMECPECHNDETYGEGCHECDNLGYWWIIPTSGHRAYPYWQITFDDLAVGFIHEDVGPPPPDLPDHYLHSAAPTISLVDRLGLNLKPLPPITRRF